MPEQPRQSDDLSELLSAYLDGELAAAERASVEQRLSESADFRQLHDELRGLRVELAGLPRLQLGPEFADAVLRRAERAMLAAPAVQPVQPAAADAVFRPEPMTAQDRVKRALRASRWSLVAIAIALVLMIFNPEEQPKPAQVAQVDKSVAEDAEAGRKDSGDGAMIAVPRPEPSKEAFGASGDAALPEMRALSAPQEEAAHDEAPADRELAAPAAAPAAKYLAGERAARSANAPGNALGTAPADAFADKRSGARPEGYGRATGATPSRAAAPRGFSAVRTRKQNLAEHQTPAGNVSMIQCDIPPAAASEHAFERVLAAQQIEIVDSANAGKREKKTHVPFNSGNSGVPFDSGEAYLVEASPAQIAAMLAELQARGAVCRTLAMPAPEANAAAAEQLSQRAAAGSQGQAIRMPLDAFPRIQLLPPTPTPEPADASDAAKPAPQTAKAMAPSEPAASAESTASQRVLFLLRTVPPGEPSR